MPKMYDELASWWPLLSPPADYEEEAGFFTRTLAEASARPLRTVLELGSGGGTNASHLKSRFEMVLVEPSAGMRAVSRALIWNPVPMKYLWQEDRARERQSAPRLDSKQSETHQPPAGGRLRSGKHVTEFLTRDTCSSPSMNICQKKTYATWIDC